jgi:hypothetical protein
MCRNKDYNKNNKKKKNSRQFLLYTSHTREHLTPMERGFYIFWTVGHFPQQLRDGATQTIDNNNKHKNKQPTYLYHLDTKLHGFSLFLHAAAATFHPLAIILAMARASSLPPIYIYIYLSIHSQQRLASYSSLLDPQQ